MTSKLKNLLTNKQNTEILWNSNVKYIIEEKERKMWISTNTDDIEDKKPVHNCTCNWIYFKLIAANMKNMNHFDLSWLKIWKTERISVKNKKLDWVWSMLLEIKDFSKSETRNKLRT